MSSTINPVITDAGLAAAIAADGAGLSLAITHVALGAGSYTPTGLETALVDRRETVTIASGTVGVGGTFSVAVVFPENTGTAYDAKEIGFYAGNPASGGTLFAVHSSATSIVFRSTLDFLAQFSLTLAAVPTGSVSVLIDPAAAILHALIQEHEDKPDPHPQYTTDAEVQQLARTPGVIFAYGGATAPAFALKCNGAAVSRTTYASLFAAIGTTWGNGDGSTTFNVPDLRGEFLRGWDDGRGIDTGRGMGTAQSDNTRPHYHGTGDFRSTTTDNLYAILRSWAGTFTGRRVAGDSPAKLTASITGGTTAERYAGTTNGIEDTAVAGDTRPRNVAVLYCIYT